MRNRPERYSLLGNQNLTPLEKNRLTPLGKKGLDSIGKTNPRGDKDNPLGNNPKGQGSDPLGTIRKDEQKTQLKPGTNPERRKK